MVAVCSGKPIPSDITGEVFNSNRLQPKLEQVRNLQLGLIVITLKVPVLIVPMQELIVIYPHNFGLRLLNVDA